MLVLITAFPKSGSTFLSSVIASLPGFGRATFADWAGTLPLVAPDGLPSSSRREQELSHRLIESLAGQNLVAQHHTCASEYSLRVIDGYAITTLVLVRDIHDCMVSLAEHIATESPEIPWAYFDQSICQRDFHYRVDAVVDLVAAWYLKFYASWMSTRPANVFHYENIVLGGAEGVRDVLDRSGLLAREPQTFAAADLEQRVAQARGPDNRFNVGVSGRGAQLLSAANRAAIERMAGYYPEIDFRPIGIGAEA
ncbi:MULTISPECIES: hypothetical protein [unclassified Caulobacter]|uniref:hypothetical protein n=1 Tax=unclassified Caulobacter TaxID=2648921 RepID=UPI0004A77596|nr:hypothetical protein [Caulobacter sp. UNC358MFTsu5.1]